MAEAGTVSAAPAAPAVDPKGTAANIAKAVTDKATGKAPEAGGKAEAPATATQVDPNAGKKKYVVNGKEVFLTSEQADAYVQKGLAFEPRISELARLQQETSQFLQLLKQDPGKVLYNAKVGLTPKDALEKILGSAKISDEIKEVVGQWYYQNVVKRAQMDPKDAAILDRDERIKELTAGEKAREEAAIARDNQARVEQALVTLKGQIGEALTDLGLSNIDTPLGAQLARRVADVMRLSYLRHQPVTAKEAAAKVRSEIKEFQRSFYDSLDEDKLVEELGKENAEKVRKYFLKMVKEAEKNEKKDPEGGRPSAKRDERKTLSPDEFREYLDGLKKQGK